MSRLSGQSDVVIGTPIANRIRAEVEPLVGFFVNTLALRLDLSDRPAVDEMLQRVKERALAAQQHQELPFEQVVEITNPARSISHTPLFQVMFNWNNNDDGEIALPGLTLSPIAIPRRIAKFDLTLDLSEAGRCIAGGIEYATALFDPRHYRTLLRLPEDPLTGHGCPRRTAHRPAADPEPQRAPAAADRLERHAGRVSPEHLHPGTLRSPRGTTGQMPLPLSAKTNN